MCKNTVHSFTVTGLAKGLALACLELNGGESTGELKAWISPAEPCVPLLGYITGAGTCVGCCVLGGGGEADFLLP